MSFEDAAACGMAAVTALQALRNKGNIHAEQKVLVYGSGGGVGSFTVQLAKYFGAEVTAVCSPNNVEITHSLGAEHVIDYVNEDVTDIGKDYDLILAVNGNHSLNYYSHLLAPGGRCIMVGGDLSQVFKFLVFGRLWSIGSKKMSALSAKASAQDLEFIIQLVEDGKVKPVIDQRYPLEGTAEAICYLSQGHARGKVIINVVEGK